MELKITNTEKPREKKKDDNWHKNSTVEASGAEYGLAFSLQRIS